MSAGFSADQIREQAEKRAETERSEFCQDEPEPETGPDGIYPLINQIVDPVENSVV